MTYARSACDSVVSFDDAAYELGDDGSISAPIWRYMRCRFPHEIVDGITTHSYTFIGGQPIGNGFRLATLPDLDDRLAAAHVNMRCRHGSPRSIPTPMPIRTVTAQPSMHPTPPTAMPAIPTATPMYPSGELRYSAPPLVAMAAPLAATRVRCSGSQALSAPSGSISDGPRAFLKHLGACRRRTLKTCV